MQGNTNGYGGRGTSSGGGASRPYDMYHQTVGEEPTQRRGTRTQNAAQTTQTRRKSAQGDGLSYGGASIYDAPRQSAGSRDGLKYDGASVYDPPRRTQQPQRQARQTTQMPPNVVDRTAEGMPNVYGADYVRRAPQQPPQAAPHSATQVPYTPIPQPPQTEQETQLDVAERPAVMDVPSRDIPFRQQGPRLRSAAIAAVMTLVIAAGGFVTGRIKNSKSNAVTPTVSPSPKASAKASEAPETVGRVTSLALGTTTPLFGSGRLKIDFEVDEDSTVRVEILNADGTVFTTVENAMEISKGKMRTYFDGTDENGEWITIGSYQVRVSVLAAVKDNEKSSQSPAQSEETDAEQAAQSEDDSPQQTVWRVDNSMTADFSVNQEPRRTQNTKPGRISTPTPDATPSESEEPTQSPTPSQSTTPSQTPTPSPTPTPTPPPVTPPSPDQPDPPSPDQPDPPSPDQPDPPSGGEQQGE